MRRQPQIIIRAEVDHFFPVEGGDGFLLALQHAQMKILILRLQFFERIVQILELRACSSCRHEFPLEIFAAVGARYFAEPLG